MSDPSPRPLGEPAASAPVPARTVAAMLVGLEALALAGFAVFYGYELVVGAGSSPAVVSMSGLVIVLAAVGLGVVARGWLRWTRWPRTPTVVANLLLVPVGWGLTQGGRPTAGLALLGLALLTAAIALVAPRPADPDEADPDADATPDTTGQA